MRETKRFRNPSTFAVSLPAPPPHNGHALVTFTCSVCHLPQTAISHAVNGKGEAVCHACAAEFLCKIAGT